MDYLPTIYACGDAYYLGKVLDAVAMICGTNGGLVGATAVGALIGVIIIAFQTVIRLNGINIHHMLVCWVIYVISFGTTTDVAIQSVYSDGSVVQKDNVPAGPAWIGVIVSNIGYHMTKKMEQAFGDVDERAVITNNNGNGFANALYILNHMSQFGEKGPLRAAMAKTTTGRDLLTNLTVYTRDCTTKAIYLGPKWGGKTYEQIITQPIEKAFEFESKIYFTEVRNAGQTLELSCTDAWKTITEQMNGKAFDEIDTYSVQDLANKAGFCTRKADGSSSCDVETPDELMNKFQRTSLNALSDSSVKAQKYMLTSVGRNILNLGLAQGYATYKDTTSAAMLAQAIEQRNVQWAAEQSMFLNSVRPMMAFMESFFYALTPFAAVFVMLGLFGLGLFFKYILLLIWVQMWLPVMAIANMYIMSAAKREMNSIISGFAGQNFEAAKNGSISIYAYDQMLGAAKDWVATGAMFQAATPLLSLIIISGSVYALTSLTSRMAGADHINEKIVAPDVVAPAAAIGMQSAYTANTFGAFLNGAKAPMLNIGEALNAQNSYATEQAHQSVKQLQHEFNNAVLESGGWGNMHSLVGSSTWQKGSSSEKALATNVQKIKEFASSMGSELSDSSATEIALAMSAGVGASGGGGVKGAKGPGAVGAILSAVNAKLSGTSTSKEAKTGAIKDAITELTRGGFSISDSDKVSIIEGVTGSFSEQGSTGNTHQKMGSRGESLKEALSDARSKIEKSQQVKSYSQSLGHSRTLDLFDIANRAGAEGFGQLYAEVKANIENKYGEGAGRALDSYAAKWERENKASFPLGTNSDIAGKINALLNFDFGQQGMDQEDFNVRDKFFNKLNEVVALPMNSGYQGGSDAFNKVDPDGPYDTGRVGGQNVKQESDGLIKSSEEKTDKNPYYLYDNAGKQAQTSYDTLTKSKTDELYHQERIQHAKSYKGSGMESLLVEGTWLAPTTEKGYAGEFTDFIKQRMPGHDNVVDPGNDDYLFRNMGKKENQEIVMDAANQAAAHKGFTPRDDSSSDQADLVDKIQKLYASTYLKNGNEYRPYEDKDGTVLDSGHATYTQFVNGKVQAADRHLKDTVADLARGYGYSDKDAEDYAENVANVTQAAAIGNHNAERVLTRIVKGDGFGGTSLPSIQELKEASQSNQPVQTPTSSK